MSLQPKRGIGRLKICTHGGINHAELKALGFTPEEVLDFSVSTNPFMPPPGVREIMGAIPIEQYPDSEATELKNRLSESLDVSPASILAGSGTTELIRLVVMAYFRKGNPVLILEPAYGEYEVASRIAGVRLVSHRSREEDRFSPRMEEVTGLIKKTRPQAVFICNPNNPTGKYLSRTDIEAVLEAIGDNLLILDEAYIAFVTGSWNSIDLTARGNVVILRSMTKDYGLPGLRLGYALAHKEIIENIRRVCLPWNVNIIAQKVGLAVLEQGEYLERSLLQVKEANKYLTDEISRLGFTVLPSEANYFLVKVGNAGTCRSSLLKHGIMVRDCTSFGLPEYIRIAPRTLPECEKLVTALSSILNSTEFADD
ncbi:pyridoxal phosphate-dependent aminotransferase [Chloroflexota bacterium]